jgi:hypothetical protein
MAWPVGIKKNVVENLEFIALLLPCCCLIRDLFAPRSEIAEEGTNKTTINTDPVHDSKQLNP